MEGGGILFQTLYHTVHSSCTAVVALVAVVFSKANYCSFIMSRQLKFFMFNIYFIFITDRDKIFIMLEKV